MDSIIYLRLIGLTAGTLLPLFWMVVILGYRRQRNFERVFFFLCTSLFSLLQRLAARGECADSLWRASGRLARVCRRR